MRILTMWITIIGTCTLTWTAPSDQRNDGSPGHVSVYDLRYSTAPITPWNFGNAQSLLNLPLPLPPGTRQKYTVSGLVGGRWYWFALRSQDDAGNWSSISNVVKKQAVPLYMRKNYPPWSFHSSSKPLFP
jgi:hypothetical protein